MFQLTGSYGRQWSFTPTNMRYKFALHGSYLLWGVVTRIMTYHPLVASVPQGYVKALAKNTGRNVEHSIERRTSRRFQIVLPVLFRWADSAEHYDVGQCGNIGPGGMFILTAKCPPSGVAVKVEFVLPAFDLIPRPVALRCIGQVSRVEVCYQFTGFAVAGRFVNEAQAESDVCASLNESPDVGF